ncbi:glycoside hydrolase superfamily [Lineolata rhizophorae]|uniref:glucan 1,3-beta-glucosidase n=1 Tax=Lineolata rhizophorae TaxID=578093 RepID=A0A6A6P3I4_9PEZI|nr:glycoside hydrolase superfamily [Lineolata rhizophorae]
MVLRAVLIPAALAAVSLLAPLAGGAALDSVKRDLKFDYNNQKVRGVNLGGWLVLEPWITPSMFDEWAGGGGAVDEYTFSQVLGSDEAQNRLQRHWSSWITQDDINHIAAAGMNHIRIPIGYWSVMPVYGDPYVQGAYDYLGQALDWAAGAGLLVMIDLHGAPGSQNGFDNSGRYGAIEWTQGNTVDHTIRVLNKIRDDYASHPAVTSIELLNEPMGGSLDMGTVRQFYMDGWGNLKDSNLVVAFHDAFQGVTSWNDWGDGMWYLMLDTHHYQIFDNGQVSMSPEDHVSAACSFGNQMASNNKWTICGEFSGAITDCAKWLNGLGNGARYDGTYPGSSYVGSCDGKYTGSVAGLSDADKYNIGRFVEAQLDAFERRTGWIFWTWKTESAPEWNMKDLLANGLFPQPLDSRNYPGQCGY